MSYKKVGGMHVLRVGCFTIMWCRRRRPRDPWARPDPKHTSWDVDMDVMS